MWKTLTPRTFYDDNRNIVRFYDTHTTRHNHVQKHLHDVTLDQLKVILDSSSDAFDFLINKVQTTKPTQMTPYKDNRTLRDLEQQMMAEYQWAALDWVEGDDDRRISDYPRWSDWLRRYRYNQWCILTKRFTSEKVALSRLRSYNKRTKQLTNKHHDKSIKRRNKFSNISRTRAAAKNEPARKFFKISRLHEQRTYSDWRAFPKKRYRAIIRQYKLGTYKRMSSVIKGYLKR